MRLVIKVIILWTLYTGLSAQSNPSPLLGELRKSILNDDIDETVHLIDLKETDISFVKEALDIMREEGCLQKLSIIESASQKSQLVASERVQTIFLIALAQAYFYYDFYRQGDSALKKALQYTVRDTRLSWMKSRIYNAMGESQLHQKKFRKANAHFVDAVVQEKKNAALSFELLSDIYFNMGNNNHLDGHLDSSMTYFDKALENISTSSSLARKAERLSQIAALYESIQDYSKAISLYSDVLTLIKDKQSTNNYAKILTRKALCHLSLSDYNSAYKDLKASNVLLRDMMNVESLQIDNNIVMADLLIAVGETKNALKLLTSSMPLSLHIDSEEILSNLYFKIGFASLKDRDYDASIDALYQASLIAEGNHNNEGQGEAFIGLAKTFVEMGLIGEALSNLDEAISVFKSMGVKGSMELSKTYNLKANIFIQLKDYNKADEFINSAISQNVTRAKNGSVNVVNDLETHSESLYLKALTMSKKSIFSSSNQVLTEALQSLNGWGNKIFLSTQVDKWTAQRRKFLVLYIENDFALYNQKKISTYLNHAFDMMEKIKSAENNLFKESNNNISLEPRILATYAGKMKSSSSGDIRLNWLEAERSYQSMALSSFPLSETKTVDAQSLLPVITDKVGDQTMLLYYLTTKENVYRVEVSQQQARMFKIPIRGNLASHIDGLRKGIERGLDWLYLRKGRLLYEMLIPDDIPYSVQKMVICPDGPLFQLPFETLLTDRIQSVDNPSSWPFLLHKKDIQYTLSGSHLSKENIEPQKSSFSFLGIADDLDSTGTSFEFLSQIDSLFDTRSEETTLVTSTTAHDNLSSNEQENLGFIINDVHFLISDNRSVSESENEVRKNNLLDPTAPLAFNSYLLIMSSSKTENGRILGDEGIKSFVDIKMESQTKNLIFSLWDNNSKNPLIREVIKKVLDGKSIAKSFKESKIEMTYNSQTAHPIHWAAFTLYGELESESQSN